MAGINGMDLALEEARAAAAEGEVPVGAVILRQGMLLGRGHNRTERKASPLAHAELEALQEACARTGDWRLAGAELYCTLEPCAMCAGALVLARVARVIFGARDPKFGGCGSVVDVLSAPGLNHRVDVVDGVREEESAALLRAFFQSRRTG